MKSCIYTNFVAHFHHQWLAEHLELGVSREGIDLVDHYIGVELKSRMNDYGDRIAIHSKQIERFSSDNLGLSLFWCFLYYDVNCLVQNVITALDIQASITHREAWFILWDWVRQFPI